jgi:hypothetical protein
VLPACWSNATASFDRSHDLFKDYRREFTFAAGSNLGCRFFAVSNNVKRYRLGCRARVLGQLEPDEKMRISLSLEKMPFFREKAAGWKAASVSEHLARAAGSHDSRILCRLG